MENETKATTRLKTFLLEAGVRVDKVVEVSGIPRGTFYGYLSARETPRPAIRFAIVAALGSILNRTVKEFEVFEVPE